MTECNRKVTYRKGCVTLSPGSHAKAVTLPPELPPILSVKEDQARTEPTMPLFARPPHAGFPTIESLRAHVIAGLQEALGEAEITPTRDDPNTLVIASARSGANLVHLGNLATELVGQVPRPEAEARVRAFITMVQSMTGGGPALARERLYPALRHRDFPLQSGSDALTRPAPGDCLAVLMSDEDTHTAMVTPESLARIGLDAAEGWEAAEENFARLLTGLALYEEDSGLLSLEIEGFEWLGSSLMLAPVVLQHVMLRRQTGPVWLAVPSRQSVEMIPQDAPKALETLCNWMSEQLAEPHPQSDLVYRLAPGDLTPRASHVFEKGRLKALC